MKKQTLHFFIFSLAMLLADNACVAKVESPNDILIRFLEDTANCKCLGTYDAGLSLDDYCFSFDMSDGKRDFFLFGDGQGLISDYKILSTKKEADRYYTKVVFTDIGWARSKFIKYYGKPEITTYEFELIKPGAEWKILEPVFEPMVYKECMYDYFYRIREKESIPFASEFAEQLVSPGFDDEDIDRLILKEGRDNDLVFITPEERLLFIKGDGHYISQIFPFNIFEKEIESLGFGESQIIYLHKKAELQKALAPVNLILKYGGVVEIRVYE